MGLDRPVQRRRRRLLRDRRLYAYAILTAPPRPELARQPRAALDRRHRRRARCVRAGAAILVGLATIRLRGDYLAIATFGIAVTIQLVALNWEGLTGGSLGLTSIPRPLSGMFDTPLATTCSISA